MCRQACVSAQACAPRTVLSPSTLDPPCLIVCFVCRVTSASPVLRPSPPLRLTRPPDDVTFVLPAMRIRSGVRTTHGTLSPTTLEPPYLIVCFVCRITCANPMPRPSPPSPSESSRYGASLPRSLLALLVVCRVVVPALDLTHPHIPPTTCCYGKIKGTQDEDSLCLLFAPWFTLSRALIHLV